MNLPVEVWQEISEYLATNDFLALSSCNREMRGYLCLRSASRPKRIELYLYRNLKRLSLVGGASVPRLPTSLQYLDISHNTQVADVTLPNLVELRAHRSRLCRLDTPHLQRLSIAYSSIPPLGHLSELRYLDIAGTRDDQVNLKGSKIEQLIAYSCPNLTDLSFLPNLRSLDISWNNIDQSILVGLDRLVKLDISYTPITELGPMPHLTTLVARGCRLQRVPASVTDLDLSHTPNPVDLRGTRIRYLKIAGADCAIGEQHITGLNLVKLDIDDNRLIEQISLPDLRTLRAGGSSALSQESLNRCTDLEVLYVRDNPNITSISALPRVWKIGLGVKSKIPPGELIDHGFRIEMKPGTILFVNRQRRVG